jgi:hypothetical protein
MCGLSMSYSAGRAVQQSRGPFLTRHNYWRINTSMCGSTRYIGGILEILPMCISISGAMQVRSTLRT